MASKDWKLPDAQHKITEEKGLDIENESIQRQWEKTIVSFIRLEDAFSDIDVYDDTEEGEIPYPFVKLFAIDFKDHLEVKKSGNTELKYVSWAYAWAEVKKLYPAASYEVKKFNGLPYVYDPITGFMVYTSVTIEGVSHEMWLPVLDGANKAMKATPYTYTTPKWDYNPQTRRREKIGMEERTVEAASMFDVNKAIMRCLVKNLAMFGLGLYVYAGEDLPEDAAPQPEAEPQKQPKPRPTSQKQEQPPMPCICARCNQPIKRVKLKDGSIMQAAEFAATHEGMCADCYKATRLNVA